MEALVSDDIAIVGGHPIAGKEKSGVEAATLDLFRGARYDGVFGERLTAAAQASRHQDASCSWMARKAETSS